MMNPDRKPASSQKHRSAKAEQVIGPLNPECYRLFFAEFPDPVIVADRQGKIVFLNHAAEEFLDCSTQGNHPLLASEILQTEKDGRPICVVDICMAGQKLNRVPLHLRTIRAGRLSLCVSAGIIKDKDSLPAGCLIILSDIHTELIPHTSIHSQTAVLSSIIENFPTPFFIVDLNLIITYMNCHMEKLTGYTCEETVNKLACSTVLSSDECTTENCLLKQCMQTKSCVPAVRRTIADREGRKIPVVISASILTDTDGQVIGGFETIRDITPIIEAEQKIQMLTEMTQEGILMVDENHRIIFANSKMAEIAGKSKEELVGMDISELLPFQHQQMMAELMQKVDPEHPRQLHFCTTIQPAESPLRHYRALETCMAASRVGKSAIVCLYFRDLTSRIEIERQLRDTNSFLQNIIRSSVDGIVVMNIKGDVLIFNEGAERILGYKAEELIGRPGALSSFYDFELARENMRRMRSEEYGPPGKLNTVAITLKRKTGEEVPVNFSAAIIMEGGKEIGTVGIFSDQRERLKIRRELEEARMQLFQAEKIASLGRLAAGVAHEINNPLAGVLIYAEMLLKEVGDHPQWRQDLEEIIHQTLRCKEIVTRLLEFSRQPLGQKVTYDTNDAVLRCVELLRRQTLFHDIEFTLDLQPDLPHIVGDPSQIQQVFTNLIINAANAMEGRGKLAISSRFNQDSKEVVFSFADTGPGIAQEIMDKIFEPFFTTKRPGEGTGLGLSVAYGIVQQHGGKIRAENAASAGAVFTVTLPLECPETPLEIVEE